MAAGWTKTKMTTTLSGLRVYVNSPDIDLPSGVAILEDTKVERVFYSRRGEGPTYRWLYEKQLSHWRVLRMHPEDFNSRKLNLASWKSVPETLQTQLGQHYLD
jgi:hypothetical protein